MIRVAVTGLCGGQGVTTLLAGLAQAAALAGLDVVCIDPDDQGLLAYHLGMVSLADEGEPRKSEAHITHQAGQDWSTAKQADVVLFDLARSRPDLRDAVLGEADAVLLVMSASATSLAMAPAAKAFLAQGDNRFVLINRDDVRLPLKQAAGAYLAEQFKDRLVGRVRHDEAVEEAVATLESLSAVAPHSAAWTEMRSAFVTLLNRMDDLQIAARPR
jgi:cellulose biosynthesis protein BcsQ